MRIRVNSPWYILIWKHCLLCMRLLKIILPLLKINQKDILCYCGLVAKLCPTLRPCQASLFFTISQSLFKLKSIELMMPSNRLILSPPSLSLNLSQHQGIFQKTFLVLTMVAPEKAMAPHSNTLAWKTSWTEEPGRLQSMGSLRVRHDWSDLAVAAAASILACRIPWTEEPGGYSPWGPKQLDMTEAT